MRLNSRTRQRTMPREGRSPAVCDAGTDTSVEPHWMKTVRASSHARGGPGLPAVFSITLAFRNLEMQNDFRQSHEACDRRRGLSGFWGWRKPGSSIYRALIEEQFRRLPTLLPRGSMSVLKTAPDFPPALRRLFLMLLVPLAGCAASDDGEGVASSDATVFEGARVIVGDGTAPIENAAIVVESGRITAVGAVSEVQAPAGAARVDLAGKTVMPAIVNAHMHLSTIRADAVGELEHLAYYGVGTAISLGHDEGSETMALRDDPVPGAARFLNSGRGITRPEPGRSEAPYWIDTEADAQHAVQELAGAQVDMVKIWVDDRNGQYQKLTPALYGAVIDEAHQHDLMVTAHIFSLSDAKGLLRAGLYAFAHSVRDQDVDDEFITLVQEHPDFVLVPNLPGPGIAADLSWLSGTVPAEQLATMQARATDNPSAQASFGIQARNLVRMFKAGVRISFGTDGGSPWAAHQEIEDMVTAGLTPSQVIVAATSTSAEFLGLADDIGTLATGRSADFVVLDANPLDDITNTRRIASVYLRGTEVDRAAISSRLLAAGER